MNNRLLIRPGAHKSASKDSSSFLPADLAAAYACYHDNLVEQRKLEQKLHGIDLQTKQMKRDFRQQREALERELKEREKNYWNCHRVFSAASLITESDSYRKRLYIGPQPSKAKLPRRTLERLSHLVRKLQAQDDLETLMRFQRCARFARRRECRPKTASSLALDHDSDSYELDPFELQRLAELMDERSTDSVIESIHSTTSTSSRIKRIRSAPLRIASGKKVPRDSDKRMRSAFAQRYSPHTQDETCRNSLKVKESSAITLYDGGRERAATKLAWAEELPDVVDDVVDNTVSALNVNVIDQSPEVVLVLKEKSRSNIEPSRDTETKMAPTSTEQQSSVQNSEMNFFETSRYHGGAELRYEYLQSSDTSPTREEASADSGLFSGDVFIVRRVQGEETRGDEIVDQLQSESVTHGSTPRQGFASVGNKEELSLSASRNAIQSEDIVSISSEHIAYENVSLQVELNEQGAFRKRSESKPADENENLEPSRGKEIDRDTQVGIHRRGTHDLTYNKRSTADLRVQQRKGSIALPKSSLHGLSSRRKSLTPRTHPKHSQQQVSVSKKTKDAQEARKQLMDGSATKSQPHKALPDDETKRQGKERQPDAPRKRRVSIFKRKCLSNVLYSGQVRVESQLRNRVQGFLGTIEDGETGNEELE